MNLSDEEITLLNEQLKKEAQRKSGGARNRRLRLIDYASEARWKKKNKNNIVFLQKNCW